MPKTRSGLGCTTVLAVCAIVTLSATGATAWAQLNGTERRLQDKFFIKPLIGEPIDTACYRLTAAEIANDECPVGYKSPTANRCWAECPMEYPVQCGFECVAQSTTCMKDVEMKASAFAEAAMNFVSNGVYGVVSKLYEEANHWVKCAKAVQAVSQKVGENYPDKEPLPLTKKDEMKDLLKESATVIDDALLACVNFDVTKYAAEKVEKLRAAFLTELNKQKVKPGLQNSEIAAKTLFIGAAGAEEKPSAAVRLRDRQLGPSQTGLGMLAKCGQPIKKAFEDLLKEGEKIWSESGTPEKVRAALTASETLFKDLPAAVLTCVDKKLPTLYTKILSAVYAIVDKVIDGIVKKKLTKGQVAVMAVDQVLGAIAKFDTSGIAGLLQEFWQPVCGPSVYPKDISVGPAIDAVGLSTSGWAFKGTSGDWGAKVPASGTVSIEVDNKAKHEVTVKIMSAGKTVEDAEIKVPAQGKESWTSKELEKTTPLAGKTLLLWRSVNLPFAFDPKDGGSVLAWVPSNPGTLKLRVVVNEETKEKS